MGNNLQARHPFYAVELDMYRAGKWEFFVTLAKMISYQLDENGGIRPYEFCCMGGDGRLEPHLFVGREL